MQFSDYYEILEVKDGDRIVVDGGNALLLGLYIAGKARKSGIKANVHVMVNPDSPVKSDIDAVRYAKASMTECADEIEGGVPMTTFGAGRMEDIKTNNMFDKAVLEREELAGLTQLLQKVDQLTKGEKKVLLSLPIQFFKRMEITEKKLFGENKKITSFRRFLIDLGFKISFFDAIGPKLVCLFNITQFKLPSRLAFIDNNASAEAVRKEILDYIIYTRTDVKFAIESEDKEYLYFVQSEKTENQPISCRTAFLDGSVEWNGPEPRDRSRAFSIIVVPNTPVFKKEFDDKEILILTRERAFEVYGEEVEPY